MLTARQITKQAQLTSWSARRMIAQLAGRSLVLATRHRARWSITSCGLVALTGAG
jgi:hypothetical protein